MANNAYQKYKSAQYETASPEQLLIMLYDGAIKFSLHAKKYIEENNMELANNKLKRVQDIINELIYSLDMEQGGEISSNLYKLYDYVNRRLIQANIKKEAAIIDEVVTLLQGLKESWEEAIKNVRRSSIQQAGGLNLER